MASLAHEIAFEHIVTMGLAAPTSEARNHVPGSEGCLEAIPQPKAPLARLGWIGGEKPVEVAREGETSATLGCVGSVFR